MCMYLNGGMEVCSLSDANFVFVLPSLPCFLVLSSPRDPSSQTLAVCCPQPAPDQVAALHCTGIESHCLRMSKRRYENNYIQTEEERR